MASYLSTFLFNAQIQDALDRCCIAQMSEQYQRLIPLCDTGKLFNISDIFITNP